MRLNALVLALCICVHHTRAASIKAPEKKLDDLDNVDLDNVAIEPDHIDQDNIVKEIENNHVKSVNDIPVKVIEEPVLDENSNDYVPSEDTNIIVKRIEIDLENPGPPQRQEHETQNPENYGEKEKALFAIKQTINNAQDVFNNGLQGVSNSFKTFSTPNEDLSKIQENIKTLKESFTGQIEKINNTFKTYFKPEVVQESEKKSNLEIVESRLELLQKNFDASLNILSEGVEVYSIIKEEDEAEKAAAAKSEVRAESDAGNDAAQTSGEKPAEKPSTAGSPEKPPAQNPAPSTPSTGGAPWNTFFTNMFNTVSNNFGNLNSAVANFFNINNNGNQQSSTPAPGNNIINNLFQGISLPNLFQGQSPPGQQASKPSEVHADTPASAALPAPTPAPAPASQGIFQQLQNSWNNLIGGGQNNQQPQTPPATNNPFQQTIQNIVSIIRPGQNPATSTNQQPANVAPTAPVQTPAKVPEKAPETVPATKPQDAVPVQEINVAPPANDQPQQPQPTQENSNPAPAQPGPIQQLVQNNPIIKGIQSAVQRIQGTPNPETPREEVFVTDSDEEDSDPKGHYGPNNTAQGDNNISDGINEEIEEKIEIVPPKGDEEIADSQTKPEEIETPAISDKTE